MAKRNKQQQRQLKRQLKKELLKSDQPEAEVKPKPKPKNKTWVRAGTCDSYEAAKNLKEKLLEENEKLEVKICRCGDGGNSFRVKTCQVT